ncbi:LysR family transcriptional regulator [Spartinivicinus poritis]|uniref:LysR family transcriptional regulator n=1 Tax=Spartinivicinus poritis TaxID=2994640 RepID=A0ABT5UKH7_9GAMM|nr:LysR family transcriptional regulator [Spartinivicinus sp. A2-2]MDE1465539.1 LysR family transcriptional regulator [Spartinivicinus sp. A2-2]
MSRWDGIEAFVEVVKQGSFSAAAEQLNVSNSHVSRLISRLEARLGAQLLYRSTRKVTLTDVGRVYFEQCQHLLGGFLQAELSVSDMQTTPQGLLRMTVATTFGERFIIPLLNDFLADHPALSIDVNLSNQNLDIIQGGFDLAIRMGILKDSSLIAKRIAPRRLFICATPCYLKQFGTPHTLSELQQHNCLIGSTDYWLVQLEGKLKEYRVKGRWRCNSGPALFNAVSKGLGLAQLPDYYVKPAIERGELRVLLDQYQPPQTAVWAVYPYNRHLSPKVRLFVDYLSQHLPQRLG